MFIQLTAQKGDEKVLINCDHITNITSLEGCTKIMFENPINYVYVEETIEEIKNLVGAYE